MQRHHRREPHPRLEPHDLGGRDAQIKGRVLDDQLGPFANHVIARAGLPRRFQTLHPVPRHEAHMAVVDEGEEPERRIEHEPGDARDAVESGIRLEVGDEVGCERRASLRRAVVGAGGPSPARAVLALPDRPSRVRPHHMTSAPSEGG